MTHTRRLTSFHHQLAFVAMTFGALLNILRQPEQQVPVLELLSIAGVYAVMGTFGWSICQRQKDSRTRLYWLYGYFAIQYVLVVSFAVFEVNASRNVTYSIPLVIPLLFQAVVLGTTKRKVLIWMIFCGHLFVALLFVPINQTIQGAVLYAILLTVITYFGTLLEREESARAVLDEANRKLALYAQQAEELAITKERNRLAREIHDNLGHYLTAVNMQIEAAMAVMDTDSVRAMDTLKRAQTLTKEGLSEIRRSIAALRASPTEARPLHEAIQMLVKEHQAAGLAMNYQVEGAIRPCPAQVELALYRITQEGLTNIRKHANASQGHLTLDYCNPQIVVLRLQDNGGGAHNPTSGFGLLGIRERVEQLGGKLITQTAPEQGFILQVEVSG